MVMSMRRMEPLSLSALEHIARIVGERYTGSEISELFRKAGFPEVRHDGSTKWRFVYASLERLQTEKYGIHNVVRVIQKLCDPQEYFGQAEYHKAIIENVNEVLSFYGLEVDSETGKIARMRSIKPSLRKLRSEAEEIFDSRHLHQEVRKHARLLFTEGKHFHAVFECCKAFDKLVQEKSHIKEHGSRLMRTALSLQGPLKINTQRTLTERNEQDGVKHLCTGLMRAIRNPEAHEPELDWPLTRQDALDVLSLVSFLWRRVDSSIYFDPGAG